MQSKEETSLQPISRFQAVVYGEIIYIHTHRSLQDILTLDVSNPDQPELHLVPVSSTSGSTPAARYGFHRGLMSNLCQP